MREWFAGKDMDIFFAILMERKTAPFRLFHAKPFGQDPPEGIAWMSLPVMLGGAMDAPLDMRFESPSV
jgi:hypothetical protein